MEKNKNGVSSILSDFSLIIVAVIWGSGFIAVQMAIDANVSPSLIMVLRFTIATIILFIVFFKKLKNFTKQELKCGIIAGTFLFLAFFLKRWVLYIQNHLIMHF